MHSIGTFRVFKYADRGFGIRILPSYVEHASMDMITNKAKLGRKYTNKLVPVYLGLDKIPSHHNMGVSDQRSPEPQGVSCLSGLELFVRHVALWEGEARGAWQFDRDRWMSTDVCFLSVHTAPSG